MSNDDALHPVNEDIPIPGGDKPTPDINMVAAGFRIVLEGLGIDPDGDPHMKDTPMRAARAWYNELCAGITRGRNAEVEFTTFPTESEEMVMLRGIPIRSVCSHHLLPFYGTATIAYIPGTGRLLGLAVIQCALPSPCRHFMPFVSIAT